ncbi:uncharacterized protein N7477_007761 [Penicillium maclennaniae]|uniref:uncharacterized protein n=1 Tax=Penicillium maclennaniae TaxID=1343394 RepID=UPI0025406125|nr:uncharacterized protein N7477_007761 [Penicillium maclennaniae]KAJ5665313.1 hypothetical protein N7477_007761 [Penicillium maclennaniae]
MAYKGGYLVAVVVTGAIFGGVALVFREITEGLCCLLGGFCIGMWLMTLKSGGLISGDGAKAGFILAFAGGFYGLSWSHYTRAYGSMLCTAFAGATALVLGIDCFSRAGLKEFWLYIWGNSRELSTLGLNDKMFPYHTYTYPVTRNIRVETAVIIIITAFGAIGQLRLWKVIKARRAKEEDSRQEAERKKEEHDAEIGRQLEANNLRERAEWEQMYGNGQHSGKEASLTETAIADDSRRGSDGYGSSTNAEKTNIELKDMATGEQVADLPDPEKHLEKVDEGEHHEVRSKPELEYREMVGPRPVTALSLPTAAVKSYLRGENDSEHGAVIGSEVGTLGGSKHVARKSWMNRLSWRNGNIQIPEPQSVSQEALIVHDDAASSVAGVVDDLTIASGPPSIASGIHDDGDDQDNQRDISEEHATEQNVLSEVANGKLNAQARQPVAAVTETDTPTSHATEGGNIDASVSDDNDQENQENFPVVAAVSTDTPTDGHGTKTEDVGEQAQPAHPNLQPEIQNQKIHFTVIERAEVIAEDTVSQMEPLSHIKANQILEIDDTRDPQPKVDEDVKVADSASSKAPVETVKRPTLDTSTVKKIPEQTSKVIHVFRTKEWAKHLADAETPELEPLELESKAAAPVHVDGLLQTAFNVQPPPAALSPDLSASSLVKLRRQSDLSSTPYPEMSRSKTRNSLQYLTGRSPPTLARNASTGSIDPPHEEHDARIDSPVDSHVTGVATLEWPAPSLAVREDMVRNRMSSTSLRHDPWASRNASRQSLADPVQTVSPPTAIPEEKEKVFKVPAPNYEDDVPLSKRKVMLQRQTMRSPSGLSIANSPLATSHPSYERSRSPQFAQVDPERSASRMAAWRQSVKEDMTQRRDPLFHGTSPRPPGPAGPNNRAAIFGDPCSKCAMLPQPMSIKPLQMACSEEV